MPTAAAHCDCTPQWAASHGYGANRENLNRRQGCGELGAQLHTLSSPYARISGYADGETGFINPTDAFWSQYLRIADEEDAVLTTRWKGEADAILIFTGLFAATVATFAAQSYQLLSPNPAAITVGQISEQVAALMNGTSSPLASPVAFKAPVSAIRINVLWFNSLFISLFCALLATLTQRWARQYLADTRASAAPHTRGHVHALLSIGVRKFKLNEVVSVIVTLLHIAVALFFAGLLELLFSLDDTVSFALATTMAVFATGYLSLSLLPLVYANAPYDTPLTPPLRSLIWLLLAPLYYPMVKANHVLFYYHFRMTAPGGAAYMSWWAKSTSDLAFRLAASIKCIFSPIKDLFISFTPRLTRLRTHLERHGVSTEGTKYALLQITSAIDENHELESFISGFNLLLQAEPSISEAALLKLVFENKKLGSGLSRLLESCRTTDSADHARRCISRLVTIITLLHRPGSSDFLRQKWSEYFGSSNVPRVLSIDPNPSISFLAFLLAFGIRSNLRDDDAYLPIVSGLFPPTARRWREDESLLLEEYGWRDGNASRLKMSLAAFLRFTCVVLHFSALDLPVNPAHVYRPQWQPILRDLHTWALEEIKASPSEPVFSTTLTHLLQQADLSGYAYATPPGVPPASCEYNFREGLASCPSTFILGALQALAKALPVQPPRTVDVTGSQFSAELHCRRPLASPSMSLSRQVSVGPLTWGRRPTEEFRALVCRWRGYHEARPSFPKLEKLTVMAAVSDQHSDSLKHYATITFPDADAALRFVEIWEQHPPPGYEETVVEICLGDI